MKNFATVLLLFLISLSTYTHIFSQTGQGINFQSIARDATGNPLANQALTLEFTIYKGPSATNREYIEIHSVNTDAFGLFNVVIGEGVPRPGSIWNQIDWESDVHHLGIVLDDGSSRVNLGTTQFVSVPYAQHANTADSARNAYWKKETINPSFLSFVEGTGTRVGIGIPSPVDMLHVHGGSLRLSNPATGSTLSDGLLIKYDGTQTSTGGYKTQFNNLETGGFEFLEGGDRKLVIDPNGHVGIGGVHGSQNTLHLHNPSTIQDNTIQFTQGNINLTSPPSNIGFKVGTDASGRGNIRMQDDEPIYFFTDNDLRMTIGSSLNPGVNIGTTSNPGNLRVNGDLFIHNLSGTDNRYVMVDPFGRLIEEIPPTPPVETGILSIGRFDFVNNQNKPVYRSHVTQLGTGETGALFAPVHLPHGATVNKVVFHFRDRHATMNLNMRLLRGITDNGVLVGQFMAAITSNGNASSPSYESLTDNSISYPVIDNEDSSYYILVSLVNSNPWPSTGSNPIGIVRASIHYTLP